MIVDRHLLSKIMMNITSVVRLKIPLQTVPIFIAKPQFGFAVPVPPPAWSNVTVYSVNSTVTYLGNYYISLSNNNVGNVPSSSPNAWEFINTNPNLLQYSVTLSYSSVDYQTYLIYVPLNRPHPITPMKWDTINETNFRYYSVYSYQQMLDMINTAFATSYASVPAGSPPKMAGAPPPFMTYDPITGICSLWAHQSFDPVVAGGPTVQIFMNSILYTFFDNFRTIYFDGSDTNGKFVQISVENDYININKTVPAYSALGATFYQMSQEGNTLANWNDFQSVLLTSSQIPANPENIPSQAVSGNVSTVVQSNSLSILTDFLPLIQDGRDARSILVYIPSAEYRLITLRNAGDIQKVDIQLFWLDKNNNRFPIIVAPNTSISIKFLFRKKDYIAGKGYY